MMKTYIKPEIEVIKLRACTLLDASLPMNEITVDGDKALIGGFDWDNVEDY